MASCVCGTKSCHVMHVKWNRYNIWYSLNCIVINTLIVWLYLYSCWRSNYQEGMVGIPLTDLYSPYFPTKHNNILSIKNSSILMISVSENFSIESEWVFTNENLSFLRRGICIYVRPFFFMIQSWTNSFNLSFSFVWEL